MKPDGIRMKPINARNPIIKVKMKHTGVADLNTGVKMKPAE